MTKKPVAILGASGIVGQKMILLIEKSPYFYVEEIVGSPKRIGKKVADTLSWHQKEACPSHIRDKVFSSPQAIQSRYVLSALPASVAQELEPQLAQKGHLVISNASAFRMASDVPLVIPEINGHLLQSYQSLAHTSQTGAIITNPNCVVCILALALKPLLDLAPVDHLFATTLQSASGAGYPGVPSLDLINNIVPNIPQEEEKICEELQKIFSEHTLPISLQVNRVPVREGHMISLHIAYKHDVPVKTVRQALTQWSAAHQNMLSLYDDPYAPQIQRHLGEEDMSIHIGRLEQGGTPHVIRLVILGHNLIRGAAGAAIANLELIENGPHDPRV